VQGSLEHTRFENMEFVFRRRQSKPPRHVQSTVGCGRSTLTSAENAALEGREGIVLVPRMCCSRPFLSCGTRVSRGLCRRNLTFGVNWGCRVRAEERAHSIRCGLRSNISNVSHYSSVDFVHAGNPTPHVFSSQRAGIRRGALHIACFHFRSLLGCLPLGYRRTYA